MKELKVDNASQCPFRYYNDRFSYRCGLKKYEIPVFECEASLIVEDCPLRRDSIIVNIGSLGLADSKGKTK